MMSREKAREFVASPGKFEGEHPIVPMLWDLAMEGGADADFGEYVVLGRWVLWCRSDGFVIGTRYATREAALADAEQASEGGER